MNKLKVFAALCCAALLFAACDKDSEPKNDDKNPPIENSDQPAAAEYTLTVLSNDETLGTVTGSGKYADGTKVPVTALPNDGCEFLAWSDTDANDLEREILLVSDSTITATFRMVAANGTENGHEWVDLGLSVKWATCNVGATTPEAYGNYYAWGETETKKNYLLDTYKYGSAYNALTKYCNNSSYGEDNFTDNLTTLESSDDAAAKNWGDNWRMPTDAEWTELREQCDWIWADDYNSTGIAGYEVKSKTNGNSIFLPAAASRYGDNPYDAGSYGGYWSSSLYPDYPGYAWSVYFSSDGVDRYNYGRYGGHSVRPVLK